MKNMDDLVFYTEPTTTTTSTTKKFYEYPKGWNKKKKENKIKRFFRIMYNTFAGRLDKLEVSYHRRYDSWIMDIKIGIAVGIICLLLCSIVVNSNFGSEKATEYKKESTFVDKAIDYFFNKLAGNAELIEQIKAGVSEAEIRKSWEPKLAAFKKIREKYLLYPDFK